MSFRVCVCKPQRESERTEPKREGFIKDLGHILPRGIILCVCVCVRFCEYVRLLLSGYILTMFSLRTLSKNNLSSKHYFKDSKLQVTWPFTICSFVRRAYANANRLQWVVALVAETSSASCVSALQTKTYPMRCFNVMLGPHFCIHKIPKIYLNSMKEV